MGLHDNPADNSALSLIALSKESQQYLDIKFYVLPDTLEEAKKALIHQRHMVERIRTTPMMSRVASSQPLASIAKKYFEMAVKSPGLTAEAYFQPYIDGLLRILDSKGIKILSAQPEAYHIRQDVVDDVLAEQERENNEVVEARRKGYEKIMHDVVLWHAVLDHRARQASSPFDVVYWAVTIDWGLIGFDRRKRIERTTQLPVVLYPSSLVQLLQFWIPRGQRLEDSLIESMQLPLFFQTFDAEDEKVTIKVLEAVSRFENIDDIPESTLKIILADTALRNRLRQTTSTNDEIYEIVREEFLKEHRETVEKLKSKDQSLQETSRDLDRALAEGRSKDEHIDGLRSDLGTRDLKIEKLKFIVIFVAIPIILSLITLLICIYVFNKLDLKNITATWISITLVTLPILIFLLISIRYVRHRKLLTMWWFSKSYSLVAKYFVLVPLLSAINAIYQGGVWNYYSSHVSSHETKKIQATTRAPGQRRTQKGAGDKGGGGN